MGEYIPVPVHMAGHISRTFQKSIVVIVSYDRAHSMTHVTTFGESAADKIAAAQVGDAIIPLLNLEAEKTQHFEDFRGSDIAKERERSDAMRGRVLDLLSLMLTAKRENTDEWMEYLAESMNRHLQEIGDADRVHYANGGIWKTV